MFTPSAGRTAALLAAGLVRPNRLQGAFPPELTHHEIRMNATVREFLRVGHCGPVARRLAPPAAKVSPLVAYGILGKPRRKPPEIEVETDGLRFLLDLRDDAQRLMFLGLYETDLRRQVMSDLQPGETFVDVGANVGFWSLPAAARGARVVAFEPNPWAARMLRRNLELNSQLGIRLHDAAVSSAAGRLTLYASDLEGGSSQATLHRSAVEAVAAAQLQVPVVTLDEIGPQSVDVLKIDVEGHEESVLAGAKRLLAKAPPRLIVIELFGERLRHAGSSPERVARILDGFGYSADLPRPLPAKFFDTVLFRQN
jgi:FkbM family methyltransferase